MLHEELLFPSARGSVPEQSWAVPGVLGVGWGQEEEMTLAASWWYGHSGRG